MQQGMRADVVTANDVFGHFEEIEQLFVVRKLVQEREDQRFIAVFCGANRQCGHERSVHLRATIDSVKVPVNIQGTKHLRLLFWGGRKETPFMKKLLISTAAIALLAGTAFADPGDNDKHHGQQGGQQSQMNGPGGNAMQGPAGGGNNAHDNGGFGPTGT